MLLLTEGQDGLWERFQRGDREGSAPVVPRWIRSAELGVETVGPAHPAGVGFADLVVRREASLGVLAEGTSVIDVLEATIETQGLLAIVADAQGVIVRARGGDAFGKEVTKTRLVEGARWDESARGTNAIGTALTERASIAVVGRAHWEQANHALFCYASPIVDPFGDLVSIIDVTGPLALDSPSIGAGVRSAAASIEKILRARAHARAERGSRRLIERMIAACSSPAVLVEAPGFIGARNRAAVAELGLDEEVIPVERLFGVRFTELERLVPSSPMIFETRRRRFSVELEPILSDGRLLALVCIFKSLARTTTAWTPDTGAPMSQAFDGIFSEDVDVNLAKRAASRLAPSDVPVLLLAETGTGKELFAQAIHRASARAAGPFIPVNCGALTGALLETELFGYAPGAFTGARPQGADGKIAAAHRGTLFLDEIAEMSLPAQAMLLRFLEDGSFTRVGDVAQRRSDIRLLCATCRDLPRLVRDGAFRQDLFFRIQGGCIKLPALRARTDRIALARALLKKLTKEDVTLGASAEAWVLDHAWPGNVRELKMALAHAIALAGSGPLLREHFPEPLLVDTPPSSNDGRPTRRAAMRSLAVEALQRAGGNMTEAARALGIARSTLYRMLPRDR